MYTHITRSGPEVIKNISCSTQLSMKFFLLINVEMPTVVGILTFKSRKNYGKLLIIMEIILMPTVVGISTFMSRKNSILGGLSEPEKCWIP